MKILIVHHDVKTTDALSRLLQKQRYDVDAVFRKIDGLHYANSGLYDIVLIQDGMSLETTVPTIILAEPIDSDALLTEIIQSQEPDVPHRILLGDISLDTRNMSLVNSTMTIPLTKHEFDMFVIFIEHINEIVQKEYFALEIWDDTSVLNHVEVYVSHLRKKLTNMCSKNTIKTIRNKGYVLVINK